jgi:hypothetical protein
MSVAIRVEPAVGDAPTISNTLVAADDYEARLSVLREEMRIRFEVNDRLDSIQSRQLLSLKSIASTYVGSNTIAMTPNVMFTNVKYTPRVQGPVKDYSVNNTLKGDAGPAMAYLFGGAYGASPAIHTSLTTNAWTHTEFVPETLKCLISLGTSTLDAVQWDAAATTGELGFCTNVEEFAYTNLKLRPIFENEAYPFADSLMLGTMNKNGLGYSNFNESIKFIPNERYDELATAVKRINSAIEISGMVSEALISTAAEVIGARFKKLDFLSAVVSDVFALTGADYTQYTNMQQKFAANLSDRKWTQGQLQQRTITRAGGFLISTTSFALDGKDVILTDDSIWLSGPPRYEVGEPYSVYIPGGPKTTILGLAGNTTEYKILTVSEIKDGLMPWGTCLTRQYTNQGPLLNNQLGYEMDFQVGIDEVVSVGGVLQPHVYDTILLNNQPIARYDGFAWIDKSSLYSGQY